MAMRLTGMMSGMDTETIIQELVAVRKKKVDVVKKNQIRLNWQQDAWKDLNKKLKGFQTKYLNNMRFSSAYSKKASKISNDSIASVITGDNAVNGVQTLSVESLAKTGYLTGAQLKGKGGAGLTALSKMSDIEGFTDEGTISVKTGGKTSEINITADTTISDVLTEMKKMGLNASFDAKNQRFFVSASKSGQASDFSITASDANGDAALSALGLKVNLNNDTAAMAEYQKYANYFDANDRTATLNNMKNLIQAETEKRTNAYLKSYKTAKASLKAAEDRIKEIKDKYTASGKTLEALDKYDADISTQNDAVKAIQDKIDALPDTATEAEKTQLADEMKAAKEKLTALQEERADRVEMDAKTANAASLNQQMTDIENYITVTEGTDAEGNPTYTAAATATLTGEVEDGYYNKAKYAFEVIEASKNDTTQTGATKINASDAVIYLNGAKFTNDTNVFEINGLTITAQSETKPGETVTITTQQDTEGMYDLIKNFIKEYNSIMNEMDKLYNAASSKGYEPLTEDEKYEMSDKEVEDWEKKIKDSILRRDETVSSVKSALWDIMSAGVEVNGKRRYLSDFGINTLGYFNSADNEKHAYHIDGDKDDESTANNVDKLQSMISSDPDMVSAFFSALSKNLYDKMDKMSSSVKDQRTYGSFFDDKRMKAEYDEYTKKIATMEKKLTAYEDKWYKKFSVMETTLAKMQSNASAITGLIGGGQ